jgi:hypothetical protein
MKYLTMSWLLFVIGTNANAQTKLTCIDSVNKAEATLHLSDTQLRIFTTTSCIRHEQTRSCEINPGYDSDRDACECVEFKTLEHEKKVWEVLGDLDAKGISISLNFDLTQYDDSKHVGGTQSGKTGPFNYVSNYFSNSGFDIPGEELTIVLMYGEKGTAYNDLSRARLSCLWR